MKHHYSTYGELFDDRRSLAQSFAREGVVSHSEHFLRSGGVAHTYVDFDYLANDPVDSRRIVGLYSNKIEEILREREIDFLASIEKATGGTVGILRLAGAISIEVGIPNLVVRPAKEIPSERVKMPPVSGRPFGERLLDMKVVLLTDHCTRGNELLRGVRAVDYVGGTVTDIITYTLVPSEVKSEAFLRENVQLHWFYEVHLGTDHADIVSTGQVVARSSLQARTG